MADYSFDGTRFRKKSTGDKVAEMDRDTIRHKGALVKILKGLKTQAIDILIGTQMVAKGHDFPNITLVGIVCADLSLNFPDFRASEQTFQLLAQVSGRAGRGDRPGKVILQTYNPDHFSIVCAKHQDMEAFYEREIAFRKALRYPPYSRMIQIAVSSTDRDAGARFIRELANSCRDILASDRTLKQAVTVLGPIEAPLAKIASHFRWHMLLKSGDAQPLHDVVHQLLLKHPSVVNRRDIKTSIDVDPVFMM